MKTEEIIEEYSKYASTALTFKKSVSPHAVWERASGIYVEDVEGRKYMDFSSGVVVTNTGHCPPPVVEAIKEQAEKLICCYDYPTVKRTELQRRLAELVPTDLKGDAINKVLLLTTGAEAVEAALKIARKYTQNYELITTYGAFHGKMLLSLTITDIPGLLGQSGGLKTGFGPLAPGVLHTTFANCYRCEFEKEYPACDMLCARYAQTVLRYESTGKVAAFIVEPIQGASGYWVPPPEYLPMMKEFCEERDILFIADEIQTGFGRTGKMFAVEHYGIKPDMIVVGKGFGAGVPITGVIGRQSLMDCMGPSDHSSTFGGWPLACAAALANIEYLKEKKLIENAERVGNHILKRLNEMMEGHELIGDVRGKGLMIGADLVKDRKTREPAASEMKAVRLKCFEKGLLFIPSGSSVLRIAPPLTITMEEADKGLEIIDETLSEVEKSR